MGQPIKFTVPALQQGLRAHRIAQTIRSKSEVAQHRWSVGQAVDIYYKDEKLGEAEITYLQPTTIGQLTEADAHLGGFETLSDLKAVLARFFRFITDLSLIEVYKVGFRWKFKLEERITAGFDVP